MDSTPIIILKRPNTVKHDDQTADKTKSQPASKTLEEKMAKYEEARRRILGSDSEEDKEVEKPEPECDSDPVILVDSVPKDSPSPPALSKESPEKVTQKNNGITPLMSIEFKQTSTLLLENAMETMNIGQAKVPDEGSRQKKSLFKVECSSATNTSQTLNDSNSYHQPHHYVGPVLPNHYHVRQYVNNSILHPYANSNMNHVRAHHYPPYVAPQPQPRFNPNCLGSINSGQVNFIQNAPFSLNVPPPGYYQTHQTPLQYLPQMSQPSNNQTFPDTAVQHVKYHRHLDMNFS